MSVASLSGILEGGAHVATPRANEPIFDSVRIRVNKIFRGQLPSIKLNLVKLK